MQIIEEVLCIAGREIPDDQALGFKRKYVDLLGCIFAARQPAIRAKVRPGVTNSVGTAVYVMPGLASVAAIALVTGHNEAIRFSGEGAAIDRIALARAKGLRRAVAAKAQAPGRDLTYEFAVHIGVEPPLIVDHEATVLVADLQIGAFAAPPAADKCRRR